MLKFIFLHKWTIHYFLCYCSICAIPVCIGLLSRVSDIYLILHEQTAIYCAQ